MAKVETETRKRDITVELTKEEVESIKGGSMLLVPINDREYVSIGWRKAVAVGDEKVVWSVGVGLTKKDKHTFEKDGNTLTVITE